MESGNLSGGGGGGDGSVVEIYPLSCYYFDSKDAVPEKDANFGDRIARMKSKYTLRLTTDSLFGVDSFMLILACLHPVVGLVVIISYAAHGLRTCVEGVLLVELFQRPHVLLLQVRNSFFKLPGGRLRPDESDIEGLKRKLSSNLSSSENGIIDDWQIGECIGIWWRSDFETLPHPYLPPNTCRPKECTKLFLVRLPMTQEFVVPRNMKLLAVPLHQIHDNSKTYGPVISGVPNLLSKFSISIIRD